MPESHGACVHRVTKAKEAWRWFQVRFIERMKLLLGYKGDCEGFGTSIMTRRMK
jgi:hypothetical protein